MAMFGKRRETNMISKITKLISIFPSLLTLRGCIYMYPINEKPYVKWVNEDNSLILYVGPSTLGGNGKILIDGTYETFFWQGGDYEGMICYFPNLGISTKYAIKSIGGNLLFTKPKNNEAYIYGLYDDSPLIGKNSIKIYKQEYDIEYDAKNFLSVYFINEELNIKIEYGINVKNREHSNDCPRTKGYTPHSVLYLKFLDEMKFTMEYYDKNANGTYETSKSNLVLTFEHNEIFNIEGSNLSFDVVAIN